VLPGGALATDGAKIYPYLTVDEGCRIGVCCHELGHLLFGWPDLYDIDDSSEGLGRWCLMGAGSWNGGGDVPAHPSAWCKAKQDWVTVTNVTTNGLVSIDDVKTGHEVLRVWKDGAGGDEYFLVENRQATQYDRELPAGGLLVYHVDDAMTTNADETHYLVGLVEADGRRDLVTATNRGDAGDPFPGTGDTRTIDATTNPHTHTYAGLDSGISISEISDSGASMKAQIDVRAEAPPTTARPTLRRGSKGADVEHLQTRLTAIGVDPGPIDGIFGSRTLRAVRSFQVDRGLVVDGIVGPKTWAALEAG
jgi:immune inhibitor A